MSLRRPAMGKFRLYVVSNTKSSIEALANIKKIIGETENKYSLEVIDVFKEPEIAERDKILATPTLIRVSPLPSRRLVGNLSDIKRVKYLLGL
jgi:circadian clock protein KaiB